MAFFSMFVQQNKNIETARARATVTARRATNEAARLPSFWTRRRGMPGELG
jgi:hypothetical protein